MARRKSWIGWLLLGGDPPPKRKRKARTGRTTARGAGQSIGGVIRGAKAARVRRQRERVEGDTKIKREQNRLAKALEQAERARLEGERIKAKGATKTRTGGPGGTRQPAGGRPRTRGFTPPPGQPGPASGPAAGAGGSWICGQPTIEDGSPCQHRGQCPPGTHDPGTQPGTQPGQRTGPWRDTQPTVVLPSDYQPRWARGQGR